MVVLVGFVAVGCGSDDANPGPTGSPATVVSAAPDVTFATGSARVVGAAPGISATGIVMFGEPVPALTVAGPKKDQAAPYGVLQPVAVLDLLRGVVAVRSYGGAEVQGIGTKRYEVDIDIAKASKATPVDRRADLHLLDGKLGDDNLLWADVFVDGAGRVRRILLPVHTDAERPYGEDKNIPRLVSVDYSDFGDGQ